MDLNSLSLRVLLLFISIFVGALFAISLYEEIIAFVFGIKFATQYLFALIVSGICLVMIDQSKRLLKSKEEKIGGALIALFIFLGFDISILISSFFAQFTLIVLIVFSLGLIISIYLVLAYRFGKEKEKLKGKHIVLSIVALAAFLLLFYFFSIYKTFILSSFQFGKFISPMISYNYNDSFLQFSLISLPQAQITALIPKSEMFKIPSLISSVMSKNLTKVSSIPFVIFAAINSSQINASNLNSLGISLPQNYYQNLIEGKWNEFNASSLNMYITRNGSTICALIFNYIPKIQMTHLINGTNCSD